LVALFGIFVLLIIFIYVQGISLVQLGITTENFSSAVLPYASAAGISIFGLIVLAKIMKNKSAEKWYRDPHFLFLFIPISFAQQFVFQGFILFKLESVFSYASAILITALIFGYMHTIYPRPLFSMFLGTLAGILFAALYASYPNFLLASLTHSLLNFTAVYLGFFTFLDSKGAPEKTRI
jgi:membrane protease YdiL (CAAX protease family)